MAGLNRQLPERIEAFDVGPTTFVDIRNMPAVRRKRVRSTAFEAIETNLDGIGRSRAALCAPGDQDERHGFRQALRAARIRDGDAFDREAFMASFRPNIADWEQDRDKFEMSFAISDTTTREAYGFFAFYNMTVNRSLTPWRLQAMPAPFFKPELADRGSGRYKTLSRFLVWFLQNDFTLGSNAARVVQWNFPTERADHQWPLTLPFVFDALEAASVVTVNNDAATPHLVSARRQRGGA